MNQQDAVAQLHHKIAELMSANIADLNGLRISIAIALVSILVFAFYVTRQKKGMK